MATRWALGGTLGQADAPRLVAELTDVLRRGRTAGEPGGACTAGQPGAGRAAREPGGGRTGGQPGGRDVHCDVSGLTDPSLETIDVLARLQVSALRLGHRLVLVDAGADLRALIALLGLRAALPTP